MHNIRSTSLEALEQVKPKLSPARNAVLDVIRAYPEELTDAEINH
jgi:hypothetical protein